MFSINNLTKHFGPQMLFSGATMLFQAGHRYGIIGANGSGKSTMLRIIAGQEEPSDGEVTMPKRARVGVLKQDHFQYEDVPILHVVLMGIPELWEAMVAKEKLLSNSHIEFDADLYGELEDVVLRYDGYSIESRASEILEGLNIPTAVHNENLSVLSGGYKLRVLMAQTLAANPDILLLDEPTNHLDIVSIRWLEKFLMAFAGCAVVVSHDRRFLDNVCTDIVDVDYEMATPYKGNYTDFEVSKVEDRDRKEVEIQKREREIADHKTFIDRFKAKASKARQANSKMKKMQKIIIEKLPESSRIRPIFRLAPKQQSGKDVLLTKDIAKSYDTKKVLDGVSIRIQRGERVAILGPNGIGKSTLLKITMGLVEPDRGTFEWGYNAEIGYFSQDHSELTPHADATILDWLWNQNTDLGPGNIRGKLAEVLFTKDDVLKKIGNLSGGERSRLLLSSLSLDAPNILVLDEPTNHLDIEGVESLADGLVAYEGTILLVSHNRWFVDKIATRIIEITPQGINDFPGTYHEFLEHLQDDYLDAR